MDQINELCRVFYPSQCCKRILIDHVIEANCVKQVVVKSLGYGIILGSTMVKLPQLIKIVMAQSGVGVSLLSVLLELLALTFSSSYAIAQKFPFSAWGESLFLMLVTSVIAFLLIYYDISKMRSIWFITGFSLFASVLMSGQVPLNVLWACQVLNLPLIISSKLVQAWSNFRNKNTGNLSAITVGLVLVGSFTRIFTSIQETGDQLIILSYVLSSCINVLLVMQIFIYWENTNKFIQKNQAKKDK